MSGILLATLVNSAAGGGGGGSGSAVLSDMIVFDSVANPGPASAGIQLTSLGAVNGLITTLTYGISDWLVSGVASDYEVYATLLTGALSSGTTGAWLSLGSTRLWTLDNAVASSEQITSINLAIRAAGSGVIITSANATLGAYVGVL